MKTATKIKKTMIVEFCSRPRIKCVAVEDLPEYGLIAGQRFHLVRVKDGVYKVQTIRVISRSYNVAGDLKCIIENYDGRRYTVILRRNKQHECDCPATGECYHIEIQRWSENARAAMAAHQRREREAVAAKAEKQAQQRRRDEAPLNGNQGFSILRAA